MTARNDGRSCIFCGICVGNDFTSNPIPVGGMLLCDDCAHNLNKHGYLYLGPDTNPHVAILDKGKIRIFLTTSAWMAMISSAENVRPILEQIMGAKHEVKA